MRVSYGRAVTNKEQLAQVVETFAEFDEFVFDVETTGPFRNRPERAEVRWISLAGPGATAVIPMGHPNGEQVEPGGEHRQQLADEEGKPLLTEKGNQRYEIIKTPPKFDKPPTQLWPADVFGALRPLFFSERRKIGHNVKFDLAAVAKYYDGTVPPSPYGDTITVMHLLNENRHAYDLASLAKESFDVAYDDGKLGRIGIDWFSFEKVAHYSFLDAKYTWLLWQRYFPDIDKRKLSNVFRLEMDVLETLVYMESRGALIDTEELEAIRGRLLERMDELKEKLWKAAGKPWNLNAAAAKGWFVYEVRGHEPKFRTPKKNEPSTKADHLAMYSRRDKLVGALNEYSQLNKLRGTYVEGFQAKLVESRLHPSFLASGTQTGRFSCAAPNLQNLPRVTDERKEHSVRSCFVAPPGYKLIVADYSQIELRIMAHFSCDKTMLRTFREGIDAHLATAMMLLQKPEDDITPEERTQYGKVVNFAIGYGTGPKTLADQAKCTITMAKDILSRHRARYSQFYVWKNNEIRLARGRRPPRVYTLVGRQRRLPTLFAADDGLRFHAERQAISAIVQGSAADIMKIAMVKVHQLFEDTDIHPVLTVHDELVIECPEVSVENILPQLKATMEGAARLRVPLVVDIGVADRWSEAK